MSVRREPDAVPAELITLTCELGDPEADLVILAEGNTSARLADGRMAVKASGSRMRHASADDFVVADPAALIALVDRDDASQDELAGALSVSGRIGGIVRRASIETLLHAAALEIGGAAWVAHTHPTAAVGSLSTTDAARQWSAPLFPDEAVMLRQPLWVPYADPGIALGRQVVAGLRRHVGEYGEPPRLILLGNHGIVALGTSADDVRTVTTMAVKAARVRNLAVMLGQPAYLDGAGSRALADRPDEAHRRGLLSGKPS